METKKEIMVIDDSVLLRTLLKDLLADAYEVTLISDGKVGLELLWSSPERWSLVILDLVMPHLDGFQVLDFMRRSSLLDRIPVIVITAEEQETSIARAYELGAMEVIQKPYNKFVVRKRVQNLIQLYAQKQNLEDVITHQAEELRIQSRELIDAKNTMVDALSTVIEYRNLESGQHIRRIRGFSKIMAEQMVQGLPEEKLPQDFVGLVSDASAMHDIGKIAIPDSVLLKPGKLLPEEFEIMKTHSVMGCEILFRIHGIDDERYLGYCQEICRYHHERWDGSGYPDGLKGNAIPLPAQIVSIVDCYDALTHKRVYKDAYTPETATLMILRGECGVFSPFLLECFRQALPELERFADSCPDDGSPLLTASAESPFSAGK